MPSGRIALGRSARKLNSSARKEFDRSEGPLIHARILRTRPMFALGEKRTCAVHEPLSALPRKRTCAMQLGMSAMGQSGHSRRVGPFIEKRYRRDIEHARARALYRFRSGLLAGPAIQNNNPDQGCDHQRATESRCQSPVIYCRDLHVCRLGGAANAICEVGHKATANFAADMCDVKTKCRLWVRSGLMRCSKITVIRSGPCQRPIVKLRTAWFFEMRLVA